MVTQEAGFYTFLSSNSNGDTTSRFQKRTLGLVAATMAGTCMQSSMLMATGLCARRIKFHAGSACKHRKLVLTRMISLSDEEICCVQRGESAKIGQAGRLS